MSQRSSAVLIEERNGSATWWTLIVGSLSSPTLSASYPSKEEALADAPFWIGERAVVLALTVEFGCTK